MKLIAFLAAALIAAGLVALSWQDQSAQDAADNASQHGPLTCQAVR